MAFGLGEALSIGANIAGGLFGDDANEDAADAVGKSNAQIQAMIKDQQASNTKAFAPYSDIGIGASGKLAYLLGIGSKTDKYTMDDFLKYNRDYAPSWYQAEGPQSTDANTQYDLYLKDLADGKADYADFGGLDNLERSGFRELNNYSGLKYGGLLDKFSQADLDSDVVYNTGLQFGLNEGVKGLNRRAASGGSYDSGATLKALTRYANDYGTTKAEGAYNRFMGDKATTYGFLSGQQGVGLNATDRNQSLNTDLVGRAVGAQQNSGAMQAQYGLQGAQALNNGIMGGIGNYLYSQRMGSGGGGVGTPGINGAASYPGYTYGNSSIPWYA
jgi:hypothetical protein